MSSTTSTSSTETKETKAPITLPPSDTKIQFWGCDLCPFAQRSWIAILEKEADPSKPVNFDYHHVNLSNKPPVLAEVNPNSTVPSALHRGNKLYESLLLNEYLDEALPDRPLFPPGAYGKWQSRLLIERHTSIMSGFYALLAAIDPDDQPAAVNKLLESWAKFNTDIQGPFVFGKQFTAVDIAYFPFAERALVIAGKYRGFAWPKTEKFAKLHEWYAACSARPAVAITMADRLPSSTGPFESKVRAEYLSEVYEPYAFGQLAFSRTILATAKNGERAVPTSKYRELMEEEIKKRRASKSTSSSA